MAERGGDVGHPARRRCAGRATPGRSVARLTTRSWSAAALVVGAVPLVVDPGGYHRFTAARLLIASVIVTAGLVTARRGFTADRNVLRAWGAVLAVAGGAALFGVDPLLSFLGDPIRLMGWLGLALAGGGFVLGSSVGPEGLRPVTTALLFGAGIVVTAGAVQFIAHPGVRPTASLGNAGFCGAYLCLILPVALSRAASAAGRARWASAALCGAGGLVLLATTTRGAWIGAAAGGATLVALRTRRWWPVAALVSVAVSLALIAPVGGRTTARGRVDTWAQTMRVIRARPVLGWGPEGFRTGFADVVDVGFVRRYGLDQIPDRAHNRFLDVAATTGVAGLAADAALLLCAAAAVRRSLRALPVGSPAWWAVAGVAGGLVAYLVQGVFLFDTFDLGLIAWVLVGVVTASDSAGTTRNVPSRLVTKLVAIATVVALFGAANFAADRQVKAASGQGALKALDALTSAAHIRPRALDTYLLAGLVATSSANPEASRRAHALLRGWDDPYVQLRDAEVLAHLALLTRSRSSADAAVAAYRAGLRRVPTNGPGWLGLGTTLLRERDLSGARFALLRAELLLPKRAEPALNLAVLAFAQQRAPEGCRWLRIAAARPNAPSAADLARVTPAECGGT